MVIIECSSRELAYFSQGEVEQYLFYNQSQIAVGRGQIMNNPLKDNFKESAKLSALASVKIQSVLRHLG